MHFKKHSTVQFTIIKAETSASQQSPNGLNIKFEKILIDKKI
jgi:hypothetical protein